MSNPLLTAIRYQDRHRGVTVLQSALNNRMNAGLRVDGHYGAGTRNAVMQLQQQLNQTPTGDCESSLIKTLSLDLTPTRLTHEDVVSMAHRLQCSPAAVAAILKTECDWPKKPGYQPSGRPTILYERHYMWRLLGVKNRTLRDKMARERPDLCQAKWGGYKGNEQEWARMDAAVAYDAECAFQSASWGLAQVMGSHYRALGYPSVFHMVRAAAASEQDQLRFFESFIRMTPRVHAGLRSLNWRAVAHGYNGPANVDVYAPRMAKNYQHFVNQGFAA